VDPEKIAQALERHSLVALDSCVLIYLLEGHAQFGPAARIVLERIAEGKNEAVASTLVLLEVQVGAYGKRAAALAEAYYAALGKWPHLRWIPMTYAIADRAARLRAEHKFKVADAIHLATAQEMAAGLFVTNDVELPAITGLEYLILGRIA